MVLLSVAGCSKGSRTQPTPALKSFSARRALKTGLANSPSAFHAPAPTGHTTCGGGTRTASGARARCRLGSDQTPPQSIYLCIGLSFCFACAGILSEDARRDGGQELPVRAQRARKDLRPADQARARCTPPPLFVYRTATRACRSHPPAAESGASMASAPSRARKCAVSAPAPSPPRR